MNCILLISPALFAQELYMEDFSGQAGKGILGQDAGDVITDFDGVTWTASGELQGLKDSRSSFSVTFDKKRGNDVFDARSLGGHEFTWQSPEVALGDAKNIRIVVNAASRLNGKPDDLRILCRFDNGYEETLFELESIRKENSIHSTYASMKNVLTGEVTELDRGNLTPLEATLPVPDGSKSVTVLVVISNTMSSDNVVIDDINVNAVP